MSAEFYYIISGLPDLHFEERQPPMSHAEFDALIWEQLDASQRDGIRMLQLRVDGQNLVNHWYALQRPFAEGGQWTSESDMQQWLHDRDVGPEFLIELATEFLQTENRPPRFETERKLSKALGNHVSRSGNDFIRQWLQFEQNLHNFLAAQDCRNFGYDISKQLADDEDFAPMLHGRREEDFGMGREYPYMLELAGNLEKENVRSKERQIDRIRWREAGSLSTNLFFSVEVLYAYRIRLDIIHRWQHLTETAGHARLNEFLYQTIASLNA